MESKLEAKSQNSATSESVTDGSEHDLDYDPIKVGKLSRMHTQKVSMDSSQELLEDKKPVLKVVKK